MAKPMRTSLISVGAAASALAAIFGMMILIGWDIPPYASMARAENIEKSLEIQGSAMLQNSLFVWEQRRDDAEKELKRDPEDPRAKDDLRKANKMVDRIECQLGIGKDCDQ